MRRTMEEYEVHGGRLTVLYLEDAKANLMRYRYAFTKRGWRADEWIRFDHKQREPSHVHLRRRTPILTYTRERVLTILKKLISLSDSIVETCRGGGL